VILTCILIARYDHVLSFLSITSRPISLLATTKASVFLGVQGAEIHTRLCAQFGDNAASQRYVQVDNVQQRPEKYDWCRALGTHVNMKQRQETGGIQKHGSRGQKSHYRRNCTRIKRWSRVSVVCSVQQPWVPQSLCRVSAQAVGRRAQVLSHGQCPCHLVRYHIKGENFFLLPHHRWRDLDSSLRTQEQMTNKFSCF
jgi:hypothetical protein